MGLDNLVLAIVVVPPDIPVFLYVVVERAAKWREGIQPQSRRSLQMVPETVCTVHPDRILPGTPLLIIILVEHLPLG